MADAKTLCRSYQLELAGANRGYVFVRGSWKVLPGLPRYRGRWSLGRAFHPLNQNLRQPSTKHIARAGACVQLDMQLPYLGLK